jgi:hypothetical protein
LGLLPGGKNKMAGKAAIHQIYEYNWTCRKVIIARIKRSRKANLQHFYYPLTILSWIVRKVSGFQLSSSADPASSTPGRTLILLFQ